MNEINSRSAKRKARKSPLLSPKSARLILALLITGLAIVGTISLYLQEAILQTAALYGNPEAQYQLGKRYFDFGRRPDRYAQGARWIRRAAEKGNAKAEAGLGLLYSQGLGVRQNYGEAANWLQKAAEQDFALAQNELGVMYAKGQGVPRDLKLAIYWCSKAAAQGSSVAKRNLALAKAAQCTFFREVRTRQGKPYRNVHLRKVESDGITVAFQPESGGMGVAKLKAEDLPADLQDVFTFTARERSRDAAVWSQLDCIIASAL